MLFHRCKDAEITLHTPRIVIVNVANDHLHKLLPDCKTLTVVSLALEDAPEALHRSVVDAVRHAGHTLQHTRFLQLGVEGTVGVLEPSVAVEQRMRVWVCLHSLVKGLEHQRVIVAVGYDIGHNAPIAEVKNGAEIDLMDFNTLIPFELCYISQPLFIGFGSIKLPIQNIFGKILRILCFSGAAVAAVLDRGLDVPDTADSQHALVIDTDAVVVLQVIVDTSIALVRASAVDLFDHFSDAFIFDSPLAQLARCPLVVCGMGHMEQVAHRLHWILLFCVLFADGRVEMGLSYLRKASLLSISSNFFSRSFSISAKYSSCLSCSFSI